MPALPKHELRQLVAVACTDDALRQLLELLAGLPKHSKAYNAMTLLSGQWQELEENLRLNLRSAREMAPDRARISAAVLQYLDELPDEIAAPKGKNIAPEVALRQSVQAIAADTAWHYDLFFSFSSHDLEPAREFCHALRGHGLRVFFSADDLRQRGGHNFGDVIDRALRQSRHFLLFCSPQAMQSEWVKLEHDTFFQNYHLPHKLVRGFFIAEGPDFQHDLVPTFYRRIQRTQNPEALLHALKDFAPAETQPKPQVPESQSLSTSATNAPVPHSAAPLPPLTAAEEHVWDLITDRPDARAAYDKFLSRFPRGHYAAEAQSRLDALDADDMLWEFASDNGSEKAIQKYLSKYPGGLHAAEAAEQLAAFEQARQEAEDLKVKEAALADLAAEAQRAQEAEAQRAKEAEAQRAKEAEQRRATAEAAAKKQREAEETADHHAFYLARTRADFEDYLKKGHALHADEAREKIAVFKKQEEEAQRAKEAEARRAQEAEAARKKAEEEKAARLAAEAQRAKEAAAKEAARHADPFHDLMLPIKGGSFDMGSTDYDDEKPVHRVTVRDFHLGKYPVTQAQWKKIMGSNPSGFTGDDNLPVEKVSWNDTQAFIKKLNEKTGKKYRLPTEAEWEYAAKGGNQSKGYKYAGSNDLNEVGWCKENSGSKTYSVGQKKPNELGLYDMSGNVWEWCEDTWHPDYKGVPNDGSAWVKGGNSRRVTRGGSWNYYDYYSRSASRFHSGPADRNLNFGFRLAQ